MNCISHFSINQQYQIQYCGLLSSSDLSSNIPDFLTQFATITMHNLDDTIFHRHLSSCQHDIIPSTFLKEVLPVISPAVLTIINLSLTSGCVPVILRQPLSSRIKKKLAVIHPFQTILDPYQNYLTFAKYSFKLLKGIHFFEKFLAFANNTALKLLCLESNEQMTNEFPTVTLHENYAG